jgi:hypothetical protein
MVLLETRTRIRRATQGTEEMGAIRIQTRQGEATAALETLVREALDPAAQGQGVQGQAGLAREARLGVTPGRAQMARDREGTEADTSFEPGLAARG